MVYVRNEGNESFLLVLRQANWNPESASAFLTFSWSCGDQKVGIGENVTVSLSLYVSFRAREISAFSFDIILVPAWPDIDRNGEVDIYDVVKISGIYGSKLGDPEFNPNSDLDDDGEITVYDVTMCTSCYGQSW